MTRPLHNAMVGFAITMLGRWICDHSFGVIAQMDAAAHTLVSLSQVIRHSRKEKAGVYT